MIPYQKCLIKSTQTLGIFSLATDIKINRFLNINSKINEKPVFKKLLSQFSGGISCL